MKLLRYGPAGQEKPGMLDKAGRVRALAKLCADAFVQTRAGGAAA